MATDQKSWQIETAEKVDEAAYNGDSYAQVVLGFRYHLGIEGLPEDHVKAFLWYRKAAEDGLQIAQACLAGMYKDGCGVPKDSTEAIKWHLKAGRGYTDTVDNWNIKNPYFEMLLWSVENNDINSFRKLIKDFEILKKRNVIERSLSSVSEENILVMCFTHACARCSIEIVKAIYLETKNLDINDFWYPPLVAAVDTGNFELAEFCLHIGADPFKPKILAGNVKITPLEIAQKNGNTKLVRLLERAEKGRLSGRVKSLFWKFERNAHEKGWL